MSTRIARAVWMAGLTAFVVSGGCTCTRPFPGGGRPTALPGRPADAAVLPPSCSALGFDLDGTTWRVTGTAETQSGACGWSPGVLRQLCEREWTFVAHPPSAGRYEVHFSDASGYFEALSCADGVYLQGMLPLFLEFSGCAPGGTLTYSTIVGDGTPPRARLTFTDGSPPSGEAEAASGVVDVGFGIGGCEWRLTLELTRVVLPSHWPSSASQGSLLFVGDPDLAAEWAAAGLGLWLSNGGGATRWLPMVLFTEAPEIEVEIEPGAWSMVLGPRSAAGVDEVEPARVVEVLAGQRSTVEWADLAR